MIAVEGIGPGGENEPRALAYLKVDVDGVIYDWQAFVPVGMGLQDFEVWVESRVRTEIAAKEAEWAALTPKTREITDPLTNEVTTIPIDKSEIVRPEIPDYAAKRRVEYPSIGDQLDALWKGADAAAAMAQIIQAVKAKYPKV